MKLKICCKDIQCLRWTIEGKNKIMFDFSVEGGTYILKYCPFCGKKLKVIK